jgi:HD superfamily phosphohydrolase
MCQALTELKSKGVDISHDEEVGARIAILMHDIGHGPFSHALEKVLVKNMNHEALSLLLMQKLNDQFNGALRTAIEIFTGSYPKKFLHQLVSGQLDVDRMDYLTRDSFFTGVSEGVIGYDRIIKMLTVHNGELMVEEKAIYSIEKFLVARRLMYWQVYLHKTVLSSEMMLVKILERVKEIASTDEKSIYAANPLYTLMLNKTKGTINDNVDLFCQLDDSDVVSSIKTWSNHPDKVLSILCQSILNRRLLKLRLQNSPIDHKVLQEIKQEISKRLGLNESEASYLAFTGEAENSVYNPYDERINILFRDGTVKDISQVDNALIHQNLSRPVKKFYICYFK